LVPRQIPSIGWFVVTTPTGPHRRGEREVTLLDGVVVRLRRLKKSDLDAVIALHRRLDDREQYFRFFIVHPPYLENVAEKLVERSAMQYAVGAFEDDALIGVANYVRSEDPAAAELAVAVAHHNHSRGVATALLRRLADAARRKGIQYFTADILADNSLMLKVLRDPGWRCTKRFDGAVLHVRIDVSTMDGGAAAANSGRGATPGERTP
jgi:GNAT superfamily N-acetyltransferase